MLPKPGKDPSVVSSYRPISLLNTLGKLFERVVAHRLTEHFCEANFFNDWQRAYLRGKEASEIVFRLAEEARLTRDSKWTTTAISLDVEKAFDSVWHDGLRYKLHSAGVPDPLLRLLSSFLVDRTIQVRVGSTLSTPVDLRAGTPQGSVLSPLLYLVYVNDIPLGTPHCRAGQFADDVDTWTSDKRIDRAYIRLQRGLSSIEAWCAKWRIKLNVTKTQLMSFGRVRPPRQRKLKLFGQELTPSNAFTILGVTFSYSNSLSPHVEKRAAIARQRIGLLRMVAGRGWGANQETVLKIYKQYVRPILEYGAVATADAAPSLIRVLERTERKAISIALRAPRSTRIVDLYDQSGLQPLGDRLRSLKESSIQRFNGSGMQELEYLSQLFST